MYATGRAARPQSTTANTQVTTQTTLTKALSAYGFTSTEISGGLSPRVLSINGQVPDLVKFATVKVGAANIVLTEGGTTGLITGDVFLIELTIGAKSATATAT